VLKIDEVYPWTVNFSGVVIGGYAVDYYSFSRGTTDLDIADCGLGCRFGPLVYPARSGGLHSQIGFRQPS